jgi:hypothetical protein
MLAGCASDIGITEQSLDNEGVVVVGSERCFRVPGDFTHPDPQPPTPPLMDGISQVAVFDSSVPDHQRGILQAELMLAQKLVDLGAPLSSDDIDVLIAAEDALRAYEPDAYGPFIPKLRDFNSNRGIEVPCSIEAIDAPLDGI